MLSPPRRIITGHTIEGRSTIVADGAPDRQVAMELHGILSHEIWNTREAPARIARTAFEPTEGGIMLAPPKRGTLIRIADIAPERPEMFEKVDRDSVAAEFGSLGSAEAYRGGGEGAHPMTHRTETIDYAIVLDGEITLIMDDTETLVRSGDVVVQVGANHAWSNRSSEICRIAFILIDGQFDEDIR